MRSRITLDKISPAIISDKKRWFAIRVPVCRELKLQKALEEINVINFIPTKVVYKEENGIRVSQNIPAIHNLIFI